MSRYKTVNANEHDFAEFERLATAHGLTNTALFSAMVNYFRVTKADPRDPKADNPTDAIKALDKRLVSFIKEQEKRPYIPSRKPYLI